MIAKIYVQAGFKDEVVAIGEDEEKAERVWKCVCGAKTKSARIRADVALRCGAPNALLATFRYLVKVIDNKDKDISRDFADHDVMAFEDLLHKVEIELHRFKGFIRFEQSDKGFFYAHYEPDNDITALLMPHFVKRFPSQPFIIHDTARNILGMYDGHEYRVIFAEKRTVSVGISDEENSFKKLWQTYYKSVNIPERKNERLMDRFLPRRYRKNLPETKG